MPNVGAMASTMLWRVVGDDGEADQAIELDVVEAGPGGFS